MQIVFFGEILPGFDPGAVREKMAGLLKLQPAQVDTVFSGRRVVLRKGLSNEEAERYRNQLEKVGIRVAAEAASQAASAPAVPPAPAPLAAVAAPAAAMPAAGLAPAPPAAPVAPTPLATATAAEEMECPKCGERQPRRTLCRACSTDMKRFAEAQEQSKAEAKAPAAGRSVGGSASGSVGAAYAPPRAGLAADSDSDEMSGDNIIGMGFEGRMGRTNYFSCGLVQLSAIFLAVAAFGITSSWFISALLVIVLFVYGLRVSALRCHDCGWSGWFSLILFIPYVGGLFGLVLLLMPGNKGENQYGLPAVRVGTAMTLKLLAGCGVTFFIMWKALGPLTQAFM